MLHMNILYYFCHTHQAAQFVFCPEIRYLAIIPQFQKKQSKEADG